MSLSWTQNIFMPAKVNCIFLLADYLESSDQLLDLVVQCSRTARPCRVLPSQRFGTSVQMQGFHLTLPRITASNSDRFTSIHTVCVP